MKNDHEVTEVVYDEPQVEQPKKPVEAVAAIEPLSIDERGLYRINNSRDEFRVAKMMMDTNAVPSSFRTPQQVVMAIQALKSLGLNFRTAIRQCSFSAQGVFTVFGDLELAVVRMSGELESIDEFHYCIGEDGKYQRRSFENSNLHLPVAGAVCRLKMKDMPLHEAAFTIEDAKNAGLWGKTPTWRAYPARMMTMRARGVAVRNCASHLTQGLAGHEYDVEGIDYGKDK